MKTFVIEREIPGAAELTYDELRGITSTSNDAVETLEKPYKWLHSYVARRLGAAPARRAGRRRGRARSASPIERRLGRRAAADHEHAGLTQPRARGDAPGRRPGAPTARSPATLAPEPAHGRHARAQHPRASCAAARAPRRWPRPATSASWRSQDVAASSASSRSRLSKAPPQPSSCERTASSSQRSLCVKRTVVTPPASSKSISISVRLVVAVPEPGEGQAARRVDLRVVAAAAVLGVLVRVAHDHAHGAADAQVDLGLGGLPVALGVPPAPQHLLAGPRVEDRLGGVGGALHAQRRTHAVPRRRRRSIIQPRTSSRRPAARGEDLLERHAPDVRVTRHRVRIRRGGATTDRAGSAGSPRASPPTPPGGRAR